MITVQDVQEMARDEGVHIPAEAMMQIADAVAAWTTHIGSQPRPDDLSEDEIEISQMGFIAGYVAAKKGM